MNDTVTIPTYALTTLVKAAVLEGVGDEVGAAIAHIGVLARQQGIDLKHAGTNVHPQQMSFSDL